jgi:hypothetical protein
LPQLDLTIFPNLFMWGMISLIATYMVVSKFLPYIIIVLRARIHIIDKLAKDIEKISKNKKLALLGLKTNKTLNTTLRTLSKIMDNDKNVRENLDIQIQLSRHSKQKTLSVIMASETGGTSLSFFSMGLFDSLFTLSDDSFLTFSFIVLCSLIIVTDKHMIISHFFDHKIADTKKGISHNLSLSKQARARVHTLSTLYSETPLIQKKLATIVVKHYYRKLSYNTNLVLDLESTALSLSPSSFSQQLFLKEVFIRTYEICEEDLEDKIYVFYI